MHLRHGLVSRTVGRALLAATFAVGASTLLGPAAHAVPPSTSHPSSVPNRAASTAATRSAASTTASVRSTPSAAVTGTAFGDANANARADSGEGLSGFTVRLSAADGSRSASAVTGPGGRYAVTVTPGKYYLEGSGRGWYLIQTTVTLHPGATQLDLRAVRPLGRVLTAALHFVADRYTVGETAHTVVTLSNTGSTTLRGITAACNRAGDPDGLGAGAGWGALAPNTPGVTIAAHRTVTATVTNTVPAAARRFGKVVVACDFGYRGIDAGYRPQARDTAVVPGPPGAIDGTVVRQADQSAVAGVRVVLVGRDTCPVLRRATTTDAQGSFHLTGLAPGLAYVLYVYPPAGLRVKGDDPFAVQVLGGETSRQIVGLVPGTADVAQLSTTCASTTTASNPTPSSTPSASSAPTTGELAATGPDSSVLVWFGAIMLLAGLALLRGRRHAH